MHLALIHDYLYYEGGSEHVFKVFTELFPAAKIYTLFHNRDCIYPELKTRTSFLQSLFGIGYKKLIFLFPLAIQTLRLEKNTDIILSSSHAFAKGVKKQKNILHISYCHTPMRYAHDLKQQYLKYYPVILRPIISIFLSYLSHWDKKNSRDVDYFIANSNFVKQRINIYYKKDAEVIYPFVDCTKYAPIQRKNGFYLVVSRLIDAKRIDLAVAAFLTLPQELIIIGTGSEENKLKKLPSKNISFLGHLNEEQVISYYQKAKALVIPGIEDFGMTSIEAQACGTPVIAFGEGGSLETVIEGKTGHFFYEQTPEALQQAILTFEGMSFKPNTCRRNALRFDKEIFKKKIKSFVMEKYTAFHHE